MLSCDSLCFDLALANWASFDIVGSSKSLLIVGAIFSSFSFFQADFFLLLFLLFLFRLNQRER